jgi:hypothetical protein
MRRTLTRDVEGRDHDGHEKHQLDTLLGHLGHVSQLAQRAEDVEADIVVMAPARRITCCSASTPNCVNGRDGRLRSVRRREHRASTMAHT